jgi:hypothetical protein
MSQRVPRRRLTQKVTDRIDILREKFRVVRDTAALLEEAVYGGNFPQYLAGRWRLDTSFPLTNEWDPAERGKNTQNFNRGLGLFSKVRSSLYVSLFLLRQYGLIHS